MKEPPLNKSPQAVKLREAARVFGVAIGVPDHDLDDEGFKKLNAALLKAAIQYGNAVYHARPVIKSEDREPKKKSIHAEPVGFRSDEQPVRWECTLCGRDKFTRRCPHKCVGGYRKKHLKWRPIYGDPPQAE